MNAASTHRAILPALLLSACQFVLLFKKKVFSGTMYFPIPILSIECIPIMRGQHHDGGVSHRFA